MAHNIIRDSWAQALQPALLTAEYIRHSTTLETKQKNIKTQDILAQPFDVSFDPNPTTVEDTHTHCPYLTVGVDITIAHSANTSTFNFLDNAIAHT
jgi:hypothetical protein